MQVAMLACGKMVPEFSHASRIKFLQCSIWCQFLSLVFPPHKLLPSCYSSSLWLNIFDFQLRSFMQQCLMGGWWCSQWTWPHAIPIDCIGTSVTLIYFPWIFMTGGARKSDLSLDCKPFRYSSLISIHNFYICCQRTYLWLQSLLIPNRKSKLYF